MSIALQPRSQNVERLEESPGYGYMQELLALKRAPVASKDQFTDLFKKSLNWTVSCDRENDPRGFGAMFTVVFSVAHFAESKKVITDVQKRALEKEAYEALKTLPNLTREQLEFLRKYQ